MKLKLTLYLGLCLLYCGSQSVFADEEVFFEPLELVVIEVADNEPVEPIIEPEPEPKPVHRELSLHQRSIPEDIFIFPQDWENGEIFAQRMPFDEEKGKKVGVVDFRVDGIRSDIDMDVYIAFSTRPFFEWKYKQGVALDAASLEIISGVTLPAREVRHFFNQPTSFSLGGFAYAPSNSLVFAVDLEDLLNVPQLYSDELYFQAIAVPAGSTDFDAPDIQSSEVDFYRIIR